jgi:hypothetical protein
VFGLQRYAGDVEFGVGADLSAHLGPDPPVGGVIIEFFAGRAAATSLDKPAIVEAQD